MDNLTNRKIEISTEAYHALRDGKFIEAIKITREKTGLGLKESKNLLQQYLKQNPHIKLNVQNNLRQTHNIKPVFFIIIILLIIMFAVFYFPS